MILDLFSAGGGWDEGARLAGYDGELVGLEIDGPSCRTAVAAGHLRVQCDVATYPTAPFAGKVDGLIASPPCTTFSQAGGRAGFDDPRGLLSHEPLRWAAALRPRWIALEQVPEVLPHWRHVTHELRKLGYSTTCGVVNAADYGVGQVRRRAVALARRDGPLAVLPSATHCETDEAGLFDSLPRWRSMADVLGWDGAELKRDRGRGMAARHGDREARPMNQPAFTITCGTGGTGARMSWRFVAAGVTGQGKPRDPRTRPADTITSKATAAWIDGGATVRRVSIDEAAALQGFREDYPWQGTQTERYSQIGNAVPPPLAAAVLRPLVAADRQQVAA